MKRQLTTTVLLVVIVCASASAQKRVLTLFLPDKKGAVRFDMSGLKLEQVALRPDGRQFRFLATGDSGLTVSGFVEVAPKPGSAQEVRSDWWNALKKSSKFKMSEIALRDSGDASLVQYMVREASLPGLGPMKVDQEHLHAYFGGEEIWFGLHVSKVKFTAGDQPQLDDMLKRVTVLPEYTLKSFDDMYVGVTFYESRDYKRAIPFFERSLAAEQQTRTLDERLFKVLVDDLGMAKGMTGDLDGAESTLKYGVSQYSSYPMFHYNLGCAAGERGDKTQALLHLKRAFELKANSLPGESVPDPLEDSSFARFKGDADFADAVKKMKAGGEVLAKSNLK